jgi:thiol-disulfide isomerase/thioredoxin
MGEPSPTPEHTPSVSMPEPATSSAAPSAADPSASAAAGLPDDPLLTMPLTDVRTGEAFTLAELVADGPVFVETMAIWCANCRAQMHEVTAAHDLADFSSVSIDVEPAEAAEDLAAYAEREGYDWPFALADAELATELRNRFGTEILFPPGMPKLFIGTDGQIELLPLGELLSASAIADLVEG